MQRLCAELDLGEPEAIVFAEKISGDYLWERGSGKRPGEVELVGPVSFDRTLF